VSCKDSANCQVAATHRTSGEIKFIITLCSFFTSILNQLLDKPANYIFSVVLSATNPVGLATKVRPAAMTGDAYSTA